MPLIFYTDCMQLACDRSVSKCFLLNKKCVCKSVFGSNHPIKQPYNHSNHSNACNHSNHKVNSGVSDKKKIFFPKKILNGRHRACERTHVLGSITNQAIKITYVWDIVITAYIHRQTPNVLNAFKCFRIDFEHNMCSLTLKTF